MIVVTGATGHYGRAVVQGLLKTLKGSQIGVSVRNPENATEFAEQGVRVSRGDFADRASLRAAFDGAEQVLLVSVNTLGDEGIRQHSAAIQAAKEAGAKRILYTSHQAAGPASAFVPARESHAPTEELLRRSGVPFVALRNGFYAESAMFQLAGARETGRLALPADGPVSWTARNDLAEAGVAALLDPGLFDGVSPPLTGSERMDFAEVARLMGEVLGRPVTREVVSDEAYRAGLVAHGLPEPVAELLLTLYVAARDGEFAVVDPTLERVLGRRPTAFREVLEGYLTGGGGALFQGR